MVIFGNDQHINKKQQQTKPNPGGAEYGEIECKQIIPLLLGKLESRKTASGKTCGKCNIYIEEIKKRILRFLF